MSKIWPRDMIRELIGKASVEGESKAELDDEDSARRFRFAIYTFRRTESIGQDIEVTINGTTVVLTKKEMPVVRIAV